MSAAYLTGCETLEQLDRDLKEIDRAMGFPDLPSPYYSNPVYIDNSAQQKSLSKQQQDDEQAMWNLRQQADAQTMWDMQQQMFNQQKQMQQMLDQQQMQVQQQQINLMSFEHL